MSSQFSLLPCAAPDALPWHSLVSYPALPRTELKGRRHHAWPEQAVTTCIQCVLQSGTLSKALSLHFPRLWTPSGGHFEASKALEHLSQVLQFESSHFSPVFWDSFRLRPILPTWPTLPSGSLDLAENKFPSWLSFFTQISLSERKPGHAFHLGRQLLGYLPSFATPRSHRFYCMTDSH